MDYARTVESFDLTESHKTKTLPINWSCHLYRRDDTFTLKFTRLNSQKSASEDSITLVSFDPYHTNMKFLDSDSYLIDSKKKYHLDHTSSNNVFTVKAYCTSRQRFRITIFYLVPKSLPAPAAPLLGMNVRDASIPHDYVLNVGDEKFYVSKSVLSFYSAYFERLFNGNFVESRKSETTLEEVDASEFGTFLQFLYPGTTTITEENVTFIWRLADRFGVESVSNICEKFVCNLPGDRNSILKFSDRIKLANQYGSEQLMAATTKIMEDLSM